MSEIKNRIAESSLIQLDITDFKPEGTRKLLDIKNFLIDGFLIKEKEFRKQVANIDFSVYQDDFVAIDCTTDAILPEWVYFVLTRSLYPFARKIVIGDLAFLEEKLLEDVLLQIDYSQYKDQKLIIKGCGAAGISPDVTNLFFQKCLPWASSIMYGEACSAVPVYKKSKV